MSGVLTGHPTASRTAYRESRGHLSRIAEFLTSRRAKITPEMAGLPSYATRRVPGLRDARLVAIELMHKRWGGPLVAHLQGDPEQSYATAISSLLEALHGR